MRLQVWYAYKERGPFEKCVEMGWGEAFKRRVRPTSNSCESDGKGGDIDAKFGFR